MANGVRMAWSVALAAAGLLLVACTRDDVGIEMSSNAPIPGLGQGDGATAWGGIGACADCDGIETRLILQRSGVRRSYRLLEVYRAQDGSARFIEDGRWRQQPAGVLRLDGSQGARRVYAVLRDGGLQARDAAGRPFADGAGEVLAPQPANSP